MSPPCRTSGIGADIFHHRVAVRWISGGIASDAQIFGHQELSNSTQQRWCAPSSSSIHTTSSIEIWSRRTCWMQMVTSASLTWGWPKMASPPPIRSMECRTPSITWPQRWKAYDIVGDWWSLGIVVSRKAVGRSPFYTGPVKQMAFKSITIERPKFSPWLELYL